ncbi:MAG: tripartite tricarboxylate transporter family receptor [Hyphomicrobiales bacterium]|nr:tripartite tricarboxylate transporter family receptor [Hyphomicrobiales bacterium]
MLKLTRSVGVIALFLTFPQFARAEEDSVARFYRGRQVIIDVGFGPGGSASLYAVALSHHMSRFIPGSPTLVVQHMPGAGGLTVANYIANTAPRDGTVFAITGRTTGVEPLMGNENAKFDGRLFNWLGTTNVEYTTCLSWHTSPVKTLQDAMQTQLIVGGTGSDATDVIFPKAINKIIGTKFKIIMGYPGSAEMDLAMERGELQGNCGLGWSVIKTRRQDWLKNNRINILFQMSLEKHPDLPDVPLVLDYAKTPADRKVLEFLFAPQEMGRPFFAPPGVPAERVDALRQAFVRTLQDPTFLNEAAKAGLEINLVDGASVQKIIETMYATPPETLQRIKDIAAAK